MSDGPSPPQSARRGCVRTLFRYGVVALVIVIAGLYFARREIGNRLALRLNERLSAAGVFVRWESAEWLTGPGIHFRGVSLFRDGARKDCLARLGNVTVLKGEPEWNRWDTMTVSVEDAPLTLGSGTDRMELEHVHALLSIQQGRTELLECRATVQGLKLKAEGIYVRPAGIDHARGGDPTKPPVANKGVFHDVNMHWLRTVKEWAKVEPDVDEPLLKVEFRSHPAGNGVDLAATLEGENFQWRGQKWDRVQASVRSSLGGASSAIEIEHARIGWAGRTAGFAGAFDHVRKLLHIRGLDSGLDVLELARAIAPRAVAGLAPLTISGGWRITGEGEFPLEHLEDSFWSGQVALDGEMTYAAGEARWALQKPAFHVRMDKQVVAVTAFQAGLWDGLLQVPAALVGFAIGEGRRRFEVEASLQQAQLGSVLTSFGSSPKLPGVFHWEWKGGGEWDSPSLEGASTLSIQQAGLFSTPQQDHVTIHGHVTVKKGDAKNGQGSVEVQMVGASLSLGSGGDRTVFDDVSLRVRDDANATELQSFLARLPGLRIEAKGNYAKAAATAGTKREDVPPAAGEPRASAKAAARPAPPEGASPGDFNLDWLMSVKDFVSMKPGKDVPVLKVDFRPRVRGTGTHLSATLEARNFAWRGQQWDLLEASIKTSAEHGEKPTAPTGFIRLGLGGRMAEIEGVYEPAGKVIRIGRLDSGIDLLRVVKVLAPDLTPSLADFSATGACRITGKGEFPLDRPGASRWSGRVDLGGDLVYASKPVRMALQKPGCHVELRGSELSFTSLKGQLWKGGLDVPALQILLPSGKRKPRFELVVTLQQAQLESVLASFGPSQKLPGTVQFDWKGGGEFDLAAFAGQGTVSIHDAEFLRIPLVGGLSTVLDKLTPGFGRDSSTKATATHRIASGLLHLENVNLDNQQTHIELEGVIDLKRQYAEIAGEAKMKAIVGLVTSPLRSRMEVNGEGPLTGMKWDRNRKMGSSFIGRGLKAIGDSDDDRKEPGQKPKGPDMPSSGR